MFIERGRDRFYSAVLQLAKSERSLTERVLGAYHGAIAQLDPEEHLPPDLRADYSELREHITGGTLDEATAPRLIEKILSMYTALCEELAAR